MIEAYSLSPTCKEYPIKDYKSFLQLIDTKWLKKSGYDVFGIENLNKFKFHRWESVCKRLIENVIKPFIEKKEYSPTLRYYIYISHILPPI